MISRFLPLCGALCLAFAGLAFAQDPTMTRDAYKSREDGIDAQYKSDSKACDDMRSYDRDVCEAQAGGKEKVTRAELDARNKPGAKATAKVKEARADAAYDVAKERCEDLRGAERAACRKDAKVVYDRTKSQARFDKGVASKAAARAATKAASKTGP
jgi:hypothetical protein